MTEGVTRRTGRVIQPLDHEGGWQEHHGDAYRCPVYLTEAGGRYSAEAATLGAVEVEGTSEREALDNVTAALAAAISRYKTAGDPIPWTEPAAQKAGSLTRWVLVRLSTSGGT